MRISRHGAYGKDHALRWEAATIPALWSLFNHIGGYPYRRGARQIQFDSHASSELLKEVIHELAKPDNLANVSGDELAAVGRHPSGWIPSSRMTLCVRRVPSVFVFQGPGLHGRGLPVLPAQLVSDLAANQRPTATDIATAVVGNASRSFRDWFIYDLLGLRIGTRLRASWKSAKGARVFAISIVEVRHGRGRAQGRRAKEAARMRVRRTEQQRQIRCVST
jgi:hypothetical protein